MDPDNTVAAEQRGENQVQTQARAHQLLPHDARELETVSKYAANEEKELQDLSSDFDQMGILRLIWDSKVPKTKKAFYKFFSLSASNREEVVAEIKQYIDFYEEMKKSVRKISHSEENTDDEEVDPYTIILDLSEKLTKMAEAAKSGENSTASSTIYELHRSFIQKHEKLENMIKRVECVALKESLRKATDGWQESIAAIGNLTADLRNAEENYDEMCRRFDRLMVQNERLLDQQRALMENNRRMEQQQEILLQENAAIKNILKSIANAGKKENGE